MKNELVSGSDIVRRVKATEGSGLRTFRTERPRVWHRTSGAEVWDVDGTRYLDLDSASAVATVGHCQPRVTEAIIRQAPLMTHAPSGAPSVARAEFYERLIGIAPGGLTRVLPAVNGALANETALQLARSYTGRTEVVTFSGTYLGRSIGVVGKAGKRAYREQVGVRSDAHFLPYPDPFRSPWAGGADPGEVALGLLEAWIHDPASGLDQIACVILEPVQGNGGAVAPTDGFLRGLRELCTKAGIVLIFDEIQAGFGRTGYAWACDHDGVVPDLMTVGKGIGGGMPVAAVLGGEDILRTWEPDAVTSTFLVNALNCVAASAAIDVFTDEKLADRASRLGSTALDQIRAGLKAHPRVGDVRGRGLLIGIEMVADLTHLRPDAGIAAEVAASLGKNGVLVGRSGRHANVIKVCPPLVITETDLAYGVSAVLEALNRL